MALLINATYVQAVHESENEAVDRARVSCLR